jgi:hypothetical protein
MHLLTHYRFECIELYSLTSYFDCDFDCRSGYGLALRVQILIIFKMIGLLAISLGKSSDLRVNYLANVCIQ